MSLIRKLFKWKKYPVAKLGRWKISDINSFEQLRKIDLANCDSCGTCSKYLNSKKKVFKQSNM